MSIPETSGLGDGVLPVPLATDVPNRVKQTPRIEVDSLLVGLRTAETAK